MPSLKVDPAVELCGLTPQPVNIPEVLFSEAHLNQERRRMNMFQLKCEANC